MQQTHSTRHGVAVQHNWFGCDALPCPATCNQQLSEMISLTGRSALAQPQQTPSKRPANAFNTKQRGRGAQLVSSAVSLVVTCFLTKGRPPNPSREQRPCENNSPATFETVSFSLH